MKPLNIYEQKNHQFLKLQTTTFTDLLAFLKVENNKFVAYIC